MTKLVNFLDEIPELDKRVYALKLLSDVDVVNLSNTDFNSWLGLLYDSIELLDQSVAGMRTLAEGLSVKI